MSSQKNRYKQYSLISIIAIVQFLFSACSTADVYTSSNKNLVNFMNGNNQLSLVTYNIKAVYKKEENQVDTLMRFVKDGKYDFVLFQELFNESTRDYILENTDTTFYRTIISRIDYNSFPEFLFQDAGLFMMSRFPLISLSDIDFGDDVKESNGVIHRILKKEMSHTYDWLANKSVLGALFKITDSTKLFLFATHVQAIGSMEIKNFQMEQIRDFIKNAVSKVVNSGLVKFSKNLVVILAGDFNSDAYNFERYQNLLALLDNPRDLDMEYNGNKKDYTFRFGSGRASRRFDYILAYDSINSLQLKRVTIKSISAYDLKDKNNASISDHSSLRSLIDF